MTKLAVVGGREVNPELVAEYLYYALRDEDVDAIVSGGARGADKGAELYAEWKGCIMKVFPAKWDEHGIQAGFLRNVEIADYADKCMAFWDGKSKGTRHTINLFLDRGKEIQVIIVGTKEAPNVK